jgi:hypothetical protein
MNALANVQTTLVLVLGVLALGSEVFAFVDALRHRPDAYLAAGKRTKSFWLLVLGVALIVGVVTLTNVLGFVGIIAFIAAAVYLADVRPALRQVTGRGRPQDGPYGRW